jgi:hypothetical protein
MANIGRNHDRAGRQRLARQNRIHNFLQTDHAIPALPNRFKLRFKSTRGDRHIVGHSWPETVIREDWNLHPGRGRERCEEKQTAELGQEAHQGAPNPLCLDDQSENDAGRSPDSNSIR